MQRWCMKRRSPGDMGSGRMRSLGTNWAGIWLWRESEQWTRRPSTWLRGTTMRQPLRTLDSVSGNQTVSRSELSASVCTTPLS